MDDEAGRARQTSGYERSLFFIRKSQKPLGASDGGVMSSDQCALETSHSDKEACLSGVRLETCCLSKRANVCWGD